MGVDLWVEFVPKVRSCTPPKAAMRAVCVALPTISSFPTKVLWTETDNTNDSTYFAALAQLHRGLPTWARACAAAAAAHGAEIQKNVSEFCFIFLLSYISSSISLMP